VRTVQRERVGLVEFAYVDDTPSDLNEDLPVLLWLHGGYVTSESWEPQRDHFRHTKWRSIYLDLPGHGQSTRLLSRYDVNLFARDILEFLKQLNITTVICIGHSLGGMVAQRLAYLAPRTFKALVLADTTYSTRSSVREMAESVLAKGVFSLASTEKLAKMSARQLSGRRVDVGPMIYKQMMEHGENKEALKGMLNAVFKFDSRPWLRHLKLPVLLLVASDNKATNRQISGFIKMLNYIKVEVITNSGHMLNWDQPEKFNQAVEDFIMEME